MKTHTPASQTTVQAYRLFQTRVIRSQRLSPGFIRITLGGSQLRHFAPYGLDQRIKIVLPNAGLDYADFWQAGETSPSIPEWQALRRGLPLAEQNALRTYTPSAIRPQLEEIDIDFVLHPHAGPGSSWAEHARPGDQLVVSGPDARAENPMQGIQWDPGNAGHLLLVGDETAVPAIQNILAVLPADVVGEALVEVGDAADLAVCPTPSAVLRATCRARNGAGYASQLTVLLEAWAATNGNLAAAQGDGFFAWIAAESSWASRLRRHLVHEYGISSQRVHFQGYWNTGTRGNAKD